MTVIPSPPSDINDTLIFRLLRKKSTEKDGLAAKVQEFLTVSVPMVDLVAAGPFRNYTLHNRDHSKKLIHLAEYLVPRVTLEELSGLECLFIIYAAFLHDMGMAVTSTERNRILAGSEFQDSIREWPEIAAAISQVRAQLGKLADSERPAIEALLYQLHEAALTAYLRPRHATPQRYRELCSQLRVAANAPDLFSFGGISLEEWLIEICASHNLDASVLSESKGAYDDRFPRDLTISQHIVNTQFCAALLRLADILDFDRERTPRILFESLGIPANDIPGADVSLQEWEKHMAVHTLEVREDEFVISAECHHPAIEKTIRDFSLLVEREIRDTIAVLKRNPQSVLSKYSFELPVSVRPRITSIGYIYKDPYLLVPEYKGNRVTVNGLRVKTFKTKHLFRFGKPPARFAFLLDVDAAGGDEVEFDVSRERLTRKGEGFLRREITETIVAALADTGVMERLTSELRLSIPTIPWSVDDLRARLTSKRKPDALQDLFSAVSNAIPSGKWPKGMSHDIAKQVGVSQTLVAKVISRLLEAGLIEKP